MLTTSSQIFTLDTSGPSATWIEQSSQPVTVHLYHDLARQMYRLISVQGSKVRICCILIARGVL